MKKARFRWFGECSHTMVHKALKDRALCTSGFVQLFHGSTFGICQQSTLW